MALIWQDMYLLRYDGPVAELQYAPSEVEDVKLVPMDRLEDIYAAQVRFSKLNNLAEVEQAPGDCVVVRFILLLCRIVL